MKKFVAVITLVIIAMLVMSGCATGEEGTVEFPTGRFVHEDPTIWAFEFDEDGTWRGYAGGDADMYAVSGKYATNGNLYTEMTHNSYAVRRVPVTYEWTYDGKNLTFELWGEDVSSERKGKMDGQTYIKSE